MNDLLKDDINLEHYKKLDKVYNNNILILKIMYYVILLFLILSYINMYNLFYFHIPFMSLILLCSETIFIINYVYRTKIRKTTIYFFIFFIINFLLSLFNKYFIYDMQNNLNAYYIIGSSFGEFFLCICLTIGNIIILLMNPFKKKYIVRR